MTADADRFLKTARGARETRYATYRRIINTASRVGYVVALLALFSAFAAGDNLGLAIFIGFSALSLVLLVIVAKQACLILADIADVGWVIMEVADGLVDFGIMRDS